MQTYRVDVSPPGEWMDLVNRFNCCCKIIIFTTGEYMHIQGVLEVDDISSGDREFTLQKTICR